MDIEYRILNLYQTRQYAECLKLCADAAASAGEHSRMLDFVRLRAQTVMAKVVGDSYEEVSYDVVQDDLTTTALAKTPRPGTTFQRDAATGRFITSQQRATTSTARTASRGITARSTVASRAATALAGAGVQSPAAPLALTVLTKEDRLFGVVAKSLFEYVLYCEGNVRKALDVALQAQKHDPAPDWWWDYSSAKCYQRLGMPRPAEESLRRALKKHKHVALYLVLVGNFVQQNQPLTALDMCKQGLSVFHEDTALMMEQARISEAMGNSAAAVASYRRVALQDAMNVEATANIAMYNFHNDQPEIALRYYRRLLATSQVGGEIYNNLGLCCLHCRQWDLVVPCFKQALFLATDATAQGDIWYNLAHVALSTGDISLARRCLQLALSLSSDHESARKALASVNSVTGAGK